MVSLSTRVEGDGVDEGQGCRCRAFDGAGGIRFGSTAKPRNSDPALCHLDSGASP